MYNASIRTFRKLLSINGASVYLEAREYLRSLLCGSGKEQDSISLFAVEALTRLYDISEERQS